jgi:hypothetical protein
MNNIKVGVLDEPYAPNTRVEFEEGYMGIGYGEGIYNGFTGV